MRECPRRITKHTSTAEPANPRTASRLASSAPLASRADGRGQPTLQAALNGAPAVQALTQRKRALNRAARVAKVAELSSVLQKTAREVLQRALAVRHRHGVEHAGTILQSTRVIGGVVQRVAMVAGEFLDPTPAEGQVLKASGSPLTSELFAIKARFDKIAENPESEYKYGEYRQDVKGAFRTAGMPTKHLLYSGPMSETDWREDRIGKDRYGYRHASQGVFTDADGTRNRAGGQYYESSDQPSGLKDDDELDLHFRGRLVDTGDGNRTVAERTWRVYGRAGE